MDRLRAIFHLGVKELVSLGRDIVLVVLIVYAFTYAVYGPATGAQMELKDASVAVLDQDRSMLSGRIADALMPPSFRRARPIERAEVEPALDSGRYTFVIEIPPRFQRDVQAGLGPAIQVDVDATAMTQAGRGSSQIEAIVAQEVARFQGGEAPAAPARLVTRARFNPNMEEGMFLAIAHIVDDITMLGIVLCGAAVVREREHGTLEHLLSMPLTPLEILLAKVWPNALVIVVAATLSLEFMVRGVLHVLVLGSVPLFVAGAAVYMFAIASLSILLATLGRTMPQFGLLVFIVYVVVSLLSGGSTPPDSMPAWLRNTMQFAPSTHFVSFSIAVLCRGATLADVWPHAAMMAATGGAFFLAALARFRRTIAAVPA